MLILLILQKRLISESLGRGCYQELSEYVCVCVCVCVYPAKVCCQESDCWGLGILKGSVPGPDWELVTPLCCALPCLQMYMKNVWKTHSCAGAGQILLPSIYLCKRCAYPKPTSKRTRGDRNGRRAWKATSRDSRFRDRIPSHALCGKLLQSPEPWSTSHPPKWGWWW